MGAAVGIGVAVALVAWSVALSRSVRSLGQRQRRYIAVRSGFLTLLGVAIAVAIWSPVLGGAIALCATVGTMVVILTRRQFLGTARTRT